MFEIVLETNDKKNYENLFKIIINKYPELIPFKYEDIWRNLVIDDLVISYNNDEFFNSLVFVQFSKKVFSESIQNEFDYLINEETSKIKVQLLTFFKSYFSIKFMSFRDFINLFGILVLPETELINFLQINKTTIEQMSMFNLLMSLKKNKKIFQIYKLVVSNQIRFLNNFLKIKNESLRYRVQILMNLYLVNLANYIKFLMFMYYKDIINFINNINKNKKSLITVKSLVEEIIDYTIDYNRYDLDFVYSQYYNTINRLYSFLKGNIQNDEDKQYIVNYIELKVGNIFYLFQVFNTVNETLVQVNVQVKDKLQKYSNILNQILEKTKDLKLFGKVLYQQLYQFSEIPESIISYLQSYYTTHMINIVRKFFEIDLRYIIKNELLVKFMFFFVPELYFKSEHSVYSFFSSTLNKVFRTYRLWVKFNWYVVNNVDLKLFEENVFNLIKFEKTYLELYVKYYFMSFYLIQDKIFTDLLNVVDDEYYYYMSDNQTVKNYVINLLSHIVTQTYIQVLQLKNLYNIEITPLQYLDKVQNNYFTDIYLKVSKTLPPMINRYVFQVLTKLFNQKQTYKLFNKILKIISLLTNDLVVNRNQDLIQTDQKFSDYWDNSKTYSISKRLNKTVDRNITLSKVFNYDTYTLENELKILLNNKRERNRKYIFGGNNIQRNVLLLQSKFYRSISTDRLLKSDLSILQDYNEILELILIFTKQLITLKPIYYEIYLEQIFRDFDFGLSSLILLFEIITSWERKDLNEPTKHIYTYQIIWPTYVTRLKYYVKYQKRFIDNIIKRELLNPTYLLIQELNMYKTLDDPQFQYLLKRYFELIEIPYHYNLDIINNKYIFQPTEFLPTDRIPFIGIQPGTGEPGTGQPGTNQPGTGQPGTGGIFGKEIDPKTQKELIEIIKHINSYLVSPLILHVRKYVEMIKTFTYQIYNFYPNPVRYSLFNLKSTYFNILDDSWIHHELKYKNVFSEFDDYIWILKFNIKNSFTTYERIIKSMINISYWTKNFRIQYYLNNVLNTFMYYNNLNMNEIIKLINNIKQGTITREEIYDSIIKLFYNFLKPTTSTDLVTFLNHEKQTLNVVRETVFNSSYDDIVNYIYNLVISNLKQFSSTKTFEDEYNIDNISHYLIEHFVLNTEELKTFIDLYYFENYMLYQYSNRLIGPIKYTDNRLKINQSKYVFLYPKYRPVVLNKIKQIENVYWINEKVNYDVNSNLITLFLQKQKSPNIHVKLVSIYRDVIESFETLGADLTMIEDSLYGFGEYETKPKFEFSPYFIPIHQITKSEQTQTMYENIETNQEVIDYLLTLIDKI